TGTGLAHANQTEPEVITWSTGSRTVPTGSMWGIGLRVSRPRRAAVSSPRALAEAACAHSCTVSERSTGMNQRTRFWRSGRLTGGKTVGRAGTIPPESGLGSKRPPAPSNPPSGQEVERVARLGAAAHLEVAVGPRRPPGLPHQRHRLPRLHLLALGDEV